MRRGEEILPPPAGQPSRCSERSPDVTCSSIMVDWLPLLAGLLPLARLQILAESARSPTPYTNKAKVQIKSLRVRAREV
jgi:hypothetical protein